MHILKAHTFVLVFGALLFYVDEKDFVLRKVYSATSMSMCVHMELEQPF